MTTPTPPPCFRIGTAPNPCAVERWWRVVENKTPLHGEWSGWRMAGKYLIAPNGVRFCPGRLQAIAWAEKQTAMKARRDKKQTECPQRVVALPAREVFGGYA